MMMMLLWCCEQGREDEVCVVIRTVLWCADVGAVQCSGRANAPPVARANWHQAWAGMGMGMGMGI